MKIVFIHHSCFLVEVEKKVLIFDWFAGEQVKECQFKGVLPEYAADTPVYVFASHKHRDHFDMDVLHLVEKYNDIHFILSKDCKMSPNFLQKHGIDPKIREKITYVKANENYVVDGDVFVETLRSTDVGVAFYVMTGGVSLFHAGDLNDWSFEEADDLANQRMHNAFCKEMEKLVTKDIDAAFIPMDPRLGENQWNAVDFVLKKTRAKRVFPMHMWQDYSGIGHYIQQRKPDWAERVVPISHENQEFNIVEV
ncbi:MAG: MBL fold metallo-hydrolase [Roseburia sp.]|nr:MBL fold metallo-hydrolase [Roseburia sp.]